MSFLNESEELVQNSEAWHLWRGKHIGASDVPGIMGTCDFKKPIDVFNSKVHGEKFEGNWATQRGKSLEPFVLALFETRYRCRLTSPSLEYPEWPTLSASLDGLSEDKDFIVEVKCPSRIKHIGALCGVIPETYKDQLQTQMLVAGIDKLFYLSYMEDEPEGFDLAVVEVKKNKNRQMEILYRCQTFWKYVQRGKLPDNF